MGKSHYVAANSRDEFLEAETRLAAPARSTTARPRWPGPLPAGTDTTTTDAMTPMSPARKAPSTNHPAVQKMLEARALIEEIARDKRPSAGAAMSHDHPDRSGRPRQGDDSTPLSGLETESSEYEISQAELETYHALQRLRDEMDSQRNELRRDILDRLKDGGKVEPGPFTARRRESNQCRPTLGNLEKLLGEDFINDLRLRLPPIKFIQLHVSAPKAKDCSELSAEATGQPDEDEDDPGVW